MATYKLVNADQLDADMKSVADKLKEKSQIDDLLLWPSGFIDAADKCSSLNFAVVGGTVRPDDTQENTIWVNTETDISGWSFSANNPENPKDGHVWIKTGDSGDYGFNALKQNEIHLIPVGAKQYESGAWADKVLQYYIDGEWKEDAAVDNELLYEPGNQHTDKTGGWGSYGWMAKNGTTNLTIKAPTIDSSGITIIGNGTTGIGLAGTSNKIDLSKATTLYANVAECSLGNAAERAYFAVNGTKWLTANNTIFSADAMVSITKTGEIALDVKNITSGYVVAFVYGFANSKIRIEDIRME